MKVGQKVIYVDDRPRKSPRKQIGEMFPKLGSTYTIRAIIPRESQGFTDEDTVLLEEIVNSERNYRCPLGRLRCELSFRTSRFRPAANIDVFLAMLDGKVAPEADTVEHLGELDVDDPNNRWSPTLEYMAAMCSILDSLRGKTEAEVDAMVWAEINRMWPSLPDEDAAVG